MEFDPIKAAKNGLAVIRYYWECTGPRIERPSLDQQLRMAKLNVSDIDQDRPTITHQKMEAAILRAKAQLRAAKGIIDPKIDPMDETDLRIFEETSIRYDTKTWQNYLERIRNSRERDI